MRLSHVEPVDQYQGPNRIESDYQSSLYAPMIKMALELMRANQDRQARKNLRAISGRMRVAGEHPAWKLPAWESHSFFCRTASLEKRAHAQYAACNLCIVRALHIH